MFERRLKIFLVLLAAVVFVLIGRAAQVQILGRDYWRTQAAKAMSRTHLVDTPRGNIYDRAGKLLAVDKPCIDARIDFRALTDPPDEDWLKSKALQRLRSRYGDSWPKLPAKERLTLRQHEREAVKQDIDQMWPALARISGRSLDQIEETRQAIVHRVQMRQRYVWYNRYHDAMKAKGKKIEAGSWKKWITEGGTDAPAVDSFQVTVSEQLEPHVILSAIDVDVQNELGKDLDKYPGLELQPGTRRFYPYGDVACHLLGHLSRVGEKQLNAGKAADELHKYWPNDLVGAAGIESLCEPTLRGTRGKVERTTLSDQAVLADLPAVPGKDVHLSIDIELQQQIQSAFSSARIRDAKGKVIEDEAVLHGAAVVMDVASDEVLALVSYPTYDLNHYDDLYSKMVDDYVDQPLRNRATMSELEPGSTVKPLCGLAGITEGVVGVNEGIECTGYLILDGHPIRFGRCWVASKFGTLLKEKGMSVAHHPVPGYAPHVGHDGNKDGWLTYSDALERSCNVFFETVADRLKIDRLSMWYDRFGLGRLTGLGIGEAQGRLPNYRNPHLPPLPADKRRIIGFSGGIGQLNVAATPIQMANAAAMIARGGVLMRPHLLISNADGKPIALRPGPWQQVPERTDLHLPPEALKAAKQGMYNVVNALAGTGKILVAGDKTLQAIGVAGKTGTAQAAPFQVPVRDPAGRIIYKSPKHPLYRVVTPSTPEHPNDEAPWYRAADAEGKEVNHAWYIGFAPADKPKIAFAVLVEYGASGGVSAASVAREALNACINRGYLSPGTAVERN